MRSGADFRFALLGKDIAQSASPRLHKAIGVSLGLRVEYTLLDVEKSGLSRCLGELRDGRWDGFNVTAPYKVASLKRSMSCGHWHRRWGPSIPLAQLKGGYGGRIPMGLASKSY